jgi:ribosomal-protein-alanine N-acetyltransferase
MLGPILDGPHVRLGPPQPDQVLTFTRWFADTEVTQYLLHRHPPSFKQEEEWLEKMAASEHDVVWAITLRDTGALIGTTGLHNIAWRHRHAWSGIMLGERAAWGHGYATEAIRLRTRYAFRELGLEKVLTSVYSGNDASRRALEKVGYRECGRLRRNRFIGGEWHDEWLGEILREEWKD